MAANLAKELGLSESKVQAALEKLMPQGGHGQALRYTNRDATSS